MPYSGAAIAQKPCSLTKNVGRFVNRPYGVISSLCEHGRPMTAPTPYTQQKNTPFGVFFCWCGRWDLNPYGLPHAPQTCASACSATAASINFVAKKEGCTLPIDKALNYNNIQLSSLQDFFAKKQLFYCRSEFSPIDFNKTNCYNEKSKLHQIDETG